MPNASDKIARLKESWINYNSNEKGVILQTDLSIIEKISQFFTANSFYYYIFNFETMKMEFASEGVKDILEIEPNQMSIEVMLSHYHPDDLTKMHDKEKVAADFLFNKIKPSQLLDYKVVYVNRIISASGQEKTILHQAQAIKVSDKGKVLKVLGVHTDISFLNTPIDHKVSFISFKYPSFFSVSSNGELTSSAALFTKREIEIIQLLSEGATAKEISERFSISEHTVRTHRKNILAKADVKNTAHLVTHCIREGII